MSIEKVQVAGVDAWQKVSDYAGFVLQQSTDEVGDFVYKCVLSLKSLNFSECCDGRCLVKGPHLVDPGKEDIATF